MFPVTLPTLIFGPYPKVFIKIFLFFIKSYIVICLKWTKYNVDLDNLYDFLHWKHSKVPPHYLFILMIITMNKCKYPEIKFICFLIFGQYQMRIKKFIKIKKISYLPTQVFSGGYRKHTYFFFRPDYVIQTAYELVFIDIKWGKMECESKDDWVSTCRNMEVMGWNVERGKKSCEECVWKDVELLVWSLNGQYSWMCGGTWYWANE